MDYDVAVVGLGGMGSAILAHCSARGAKALGLEQFERGHALGASAGRTRLIRKAYFEDPAYVPLLHRAYDLWRELERASGEELLSITGLLTVGPEDSEIIQGTKRSAREHGLAVEALSREAVAERYPKLLLRDDEVGVFEPDGGVLKPERAIAAHLKIAEAHGAELRFETEMKSWRAAGGGFELALSNGSSVSAGALVLSLGPWFLEQGIPIRVQRNVQVWFEPQSDAYTAQNFAGFLLDRAGLPAALYGFPDFGDGVKAAFHGHGDFTAAHNLARDIDLQRDVEPVARALEEWMPGAAGKFRDAKVCMYALTADHHFVIDSHQEHPRLIVCGGFSGHGFKFAPVVGEIGADLALRGATEHPIGFLSLRRFAG